MSKVKIIWQSLRKLESAKYFITNKDMTNKS